MEIRNPSHKYEDMEPRTDRKVSGVKKSAQKIAEKTRAINLPLHTFVHPPKDEKLIEDDPFGYGRINIAENGGFNDGFSNLVNPTDSLDKSIPHQSGKTARDTFHRGSRPDVLVAQISNANSEFIVRDKRTKGYTHPFQTHAEVVPDSSYFANRRVSNDSLIHVDQRKIPGRGDVLSFHHIYYRIKSKKYPWSKPVQKTILDDVSGIMYPGVNAIMGPTGSGKSSILDVLAGRKDPQFLEGKVHINGAPQPKNFKCMSGYVVQDDIVMGTLTVKENLMFSSALRLPVEMSRRERVDKVNKVIEQLGLTKVADSKIGTELIRGVSGGERKRCNIGMELITDPVVLFLDEPTTGLDAFTAHSVIKTLQKLSRRGKTIVLSIHQPKYSIYKLFDRYTLMGNGKVIYHGKAGSAPIRYFENLGYFIEAHDNPPDFYLDILHSAIKSDKEIIDHHKLESSGEFSDTRNLGQQRYEKDTKKEIMHQLAKDWQDSSNSKEVYSQLAIYDRIQEETSETSTKGMTVNYATNWGNQLKWVCWRTALNLLRNPQTSVIQLGVYLFFAFSMGIVYFGLTTDKPIGYQDRYGLFFFSALQVMFVNLGAIEIFIKERPIFIHENSSGYYRVSSYFFAKLLCDMVPIKVFPAVVFLPITYFMSKLKADAGAFFFFELILLLTTSAGCSIAFFVSSSFSVFGLANVVTPIIYVFMMVFSGYLISIDSIFVWLNWCRYISAFRYAIAGLIVNEINGVQFCGNTTLPCVTANDFLNSNSIPHTTAWDLWLNPLGLLLITIFFLCLCYIQLRRINKYK